MPQPLRRDVAFSPAVKAAQSARGSRAAYARQRDWQADLPPELAAFVASRDSAFLATASADGQPYVQHRGGPPGFLHVLGPRRIGFADLAGNRQYISVGNLSENDRVMMILMDWPTRRRLKLWGTARLEEWGGHAPPAALAPVLAAAGAARAERVVLIELTAWDLNCPQHITPRFSERDLAAHGLHITAIP